MPKYRVRQSCEYAIDVEAKDETEAEQIAMETDKDHWDRAAHSAPEVIELDEKGREKS